MKLLFGGDMAFARIGDYPGDEAMGKVMEELKPIFDSADFKMVNLENIFATPEDQPIIKTGPNMTSSAEYLRVLKMMGVSLVGLANNHLGDFGTGAVRNTLKELDEAGLPYIGAGLNIEEAYRPYTFEKDGKAVSFVAVCENEFGAAKDDVPGSAGYSLGRITKVIHEEKEKGNLMIVFFHGGNERNPFPSPMKTELYKHFIDLGADAVIAMHTHCPQGYEYYCGKPIVYSMGNFYFPRFEEETEESLKGAWYHGYMAELEIEEEIKLTIHPYHFTKNKVEVLKGERYDKFMAYMDTLIAPISDRKKLQALFDSWCTFEGVGYAGSLLYTPDVLHGGAEGAKRMKNIFSCEAHNELVRNLMLICYEDRFDEAEKGADYVRSLQKIEL